MRWIVHHWPLIFLALPLYAVGRAGCWVRLRIRIVKRLEQTIYFLCFWKSCKSFIKDWGFMEVRLLDPNGEISSPERLAKWIKNCPGWKELITELFTNLMETEGFDGRVRNISKIYGVLSIMINPKAKETVQSLIYAACEESGRTCDQCGKRGWGVYVKNGELAIRCSEHQKQGK